MTQTTEEVLAERQKTHGTYENHARITQYLYEFCRQQINWDKLRDTQKETIYMICHKLGRILQGNPDIADHYDDIAGYAKLVSNEQAVIDAANKQPGQTTP